MRLSDPHSLRVKLSGPATSGEFAGIAATWDVDRDGERFAPGAFANSLMSWNKRRALPPLLWAHDMREPIGVLIEAEETDTGLEIVGRLALGTDNGKRAHALLQSGPGALALSVGFQPLTVDKSARIPTFTEVDWAELSLVSIPSQHGAVITDVKSAYPDRKSFEHAARQALGLSANQAKRLAAGGWAAMTRNEAEPDPMQRHHSAAIDAALLRIANAKR